MVKINILKELPSRDKDRLKNHWIDLTYLNVFICYRKKEEEKNNGRKKWKKIVTTATWFMWIDMRRNELTKN